MRHISEIQTILDSKYCDRSFNICVFGGQMIRHSSKKYSEVQKVKSCDRPTRLPLFASVISLPLEFGSNEDVLECKMALTSLHDFYGSCHLHICRSLFDHSTFFVASLVFMNGHFVLCYKEEF